MASLSEKYVDLTAKLFKADLDDEQRFHLKNLMDGFELEIELDRRMRWMATGEDEEICETGEVPCAS